MKKIIMSVFIFLVLSSLVVAYELSDYPEFFLDDNSPDVVIVVGNGAPVSHVLAQTRIALSLGTEFDQPLLGSNKLASDIEVIDNLNIISIGNACDNNVTARILNNPEPCDKDVEAGKATIQLFESEDEKIHIILSSGSEEGIKEAAEVLANFDDYLFSSNIYEIDVEIEEDTVEESETVEVTELDREAEDVERSVPEPILIDYTREEPEPILREEDDLVKKFFRFIKSIFTFWKK